MLRLRCWILFAVASVAFSALAVSTAGAQTGLLGAAGGVLAGTTATVGDLVQEVAPLAAPVVDAGAAVVEPVVDATTEALDHDTAPASIVSTVLETAEAAGLPIAGAEDPPPPLADPPPAHSPGEPSDTGGAVAPPPTTPEQPAPVPEPAVAAPKPPAQGQPSSTGGDSQPIQDAAGEPVPPAPSPPGPASTSGPAPSPQLPSSRPPTAGGPGDVAGATFAAAPAGITTSGRPARPASDETVPSESIAIHIGHSAPPDGIGWGVPDLLVDPRTTAGAIFVAALGLGALLFGLAGLPRRAYVGARIAAGNVVGARLTLGLAGLTLVLTAAMAQFLR